jgi:hypothetical protein
MTFTLPGRPATADDQAHRIDDIHRLLGRPSTESHLQSRGTPFFYQATWSCGCSVECVHEDRDAYWWEKCDEHSSLDERVSRGLRREHVTPNAGGERLPSI